MTLHYTLNLYHYSFTNRLSYTHPDSKQQLSVCICLLGEAYTTEPSS